MTGTPENDPRAGERLLASACKFRSDGGEGELARLLPSCALMVDYHDNGGWQSVDLYFTAPREAFDVLSDARSDQYAEDDSRLEPTDRAINAVIAPISRGRTVVGAALIEPQDDWREAYGAQAPRQSDFDPPRRLPPAGSDFAF